MTLRAREGSAGSWGGDNSGGLTMRMLPAVWKPTLALSTLPKIKGRVKVGLALVSSPPKRDPHPQIPVPAESQCWKEAPKANSWAVAARPLLSTGGYNPPPRDERGLPRASTPQTHCPLL